MKPHKPQIYSEYKTLAFNVDELCDAGVIVEEYSTCHWKYSRSWTNFPSCYVMQISCKLLNISLEGEEPTASQLLPPFRTWDQNNSRIDGQSHLTCKS